MVEGCTGLPFADEFYMLAGQVHPTQGKHSGVGTALSFAC